jgi:NADH-quinone oxidoreductase subunit E
LSKTLGINAGETTKDGRFTLKEAECLGACVNAPMMQVDKQFHENLTPQKVDQILKELK